MYLRYAERVGWKTEILDASLSEFAGYKEVVFAVTGTNVYRTMRFESGVHRVQRVPATEAQGRIHTSTATVAVLPEAEDIEVDIHAGDLRIDIFRARGPGGFKAQLAPACRDNGIVVFEPVGWHFERGKLVLTARKGHSAAFDYHADGSWWKDARDGGKPLGVRHM